MSDQSVPKKNRDRHGWVKLTGDRPDAGITPESALASLIVGSLLCAGLIEIPEEDAGEAIYQAIRITARLLEGNINQDDFPQLPFDH